MTILMRDICFAYGQQMVLSHLDIDLPEKGIVGISGPSGCGKTTWLRLLAGLEVPASGTIKGLDKQSVSMVFQEDRLLPWLTVWENLSLILGKEASAGLWLERMKLIEQARSYPAQLSGGMKRRLALVRGLAFPGQLLLLDEPLKGLDLSLKQQINPYIRSEGSRRLVVMVTHDPAELLELADIIWLAHGPPLAFQPVDRQRFMQHFTQES